MRPAARVAALLAAALTTAAAPARAWDNQGHMATGAIAYDRLMATNPRLVARIVALMAAHPDRARFARELAGVAAGPARERLLFEYMARWPDDVGGTSADHGPWHYSERVVTPWGGLFPITFGQARRALDAQTALAADPHAPAARRAVALCWMFHIVGDMQQPLHAGTWANLHFPIGDRGGTWAWVRASAGAAPINLHDFWDTAASRPGPEPQRAAELAARLEREHPAPRPDPGPVRARFDRWTAEDRALARHVAYAEGRVAAARRPAQAPVVTAAYAAQVRRVAEARIALGGQRLADLLSAKVPR